ncbi:hypothetical protein D3C85_1514490 [compost metagenome]
MGCPVAVLAVCENQGVVVTSSRKGLTVFESGLTITHLFTHHLAVNMPIVLFVWKAPLRMPSQGLELLKEMQSEG